jgi:lipoprotein-releasing system ATP-binding protein
MSEQGTLVSLSSLAKVYQTATESIEVLRDVNLEVSGGSTVVIMGESGCGKSTLLNLMGGLDYPTSGRIYVADLDIGGMPEDELSRYRNRYVGFIFQFHFLLKDFTALENVVIPAMVGGTPMRSLRRQGERLLDEVGLSKRKDAYPHELSGGERQRVAVARALMNEPLLILADEPTGNLDERNALIVSDILFELVEKHGRTMVLVTHDRGLAAKAGHRFALKGGELSSV